MKNLKLSLKKEIISNLEAKEVKGGAVTLDECQTKGNISCWTNCAVDTCDNCLMEETAICLPPH
ncbi:MAG: hypothetical protein JXA53_04285 [Bacteroidales bacterium]|nr:hypothetical protein [Bacteroidales bacterium]